MRRTGVAAVSVLMGAVLCGSAVWSAGLVDAAPTTTAPAVRVERIPVERKQCKKTADALRLLLSYREDADVFTVGEDAGSGGILLVGPPPVVEHVVRVIGVRTETVSGADAPHEPPTVVTRVIVLEATSCKSVSRTLREAFRHEPVLNVATNEDRNAIVLRGDASLVATAERIVRSLEGIDAAGDGQASRVIHLRHAQAERLAQVLADVLGGEGDVTCDARTNAVIISASPELIASVEAVIAQLDVVIDPQQERPRARDTQRRRGEWNRPQRRGEQRPPVRPPTKRDAPQPPPAPQSPPPSEPPHDAPRSENGSPPENAPAEPTRTR